MGLSNTLRNMINTIFNVHFDLHYSFLCLFLFALIMNSGRSSTSLPFPVERQLHKLGRDIRDARLRRRISTAIMAERASISRMTLSKIEKGAPSVSLGAYATVLFVLGLVERLGDLADVRTDTIGLTLEEERLPKRIRNSKKKSHKT